MSILSVTVMIMLESTINKAVCLFELLAHGRFLHLILRITLCSGSLMVLEKTGRVGVRSPDFGLTEPLGAYPTVFQSEVHPIELCLRENFFRKLTGERIYIP